MTRCALVLGCVALLVAGCGADRAAPAKLGRAGIGVDHRQGIPASLLAGARPIGRGPRFQPPISGTVTGRCERTLGRRRPAHIEVFGANQVVLLASGIGTTQPRQFTDGRLTEAGCFGDVVTLDPTGIVYFRPGTRVTLGTLFRAWGQTLDVSRVASFMGGQTVAYVGGRPWHGAASAVPLTAGAEIVVEIGPRVPPHRRFVFPRPPSPAMR